MDFPIKILNQLRPILRGFRKARNLTQADIAKKLGITQQSYAQLEANPATASLERLFKVFAVLQVELVLKDRDVIVEETAKKPVTTIVTSAVSIKTTPAFTQTESLILSENYFSATRLLPPNAGAMIHSSLADCTAVTGKLNHDFANVKNELTHALSSQKKK